MNQTKLGKQMNDLTLAQFITILSCSVLLITAIFCIISHYKHRPNARIVITSIGESKWHRPQIRVKSTWYNVAWISNKWCLSITAKDEYLSPQEAAQSIAEIKRDGYSIESNKKLKPNQIICYVE